MTLNFDQTQFEKELANKGATVLFKEIPCNAEVKDVATNLFALYPDYHFLLESADEQRGRFCVIGLDPDQIFKCQGQKSYISNDKTNFTAQNGDPLTNFRNFVADAKIDFSGQSYQNEPLPAIFSGVFGYFGYEMVNLMEKSLSSQEKRDEIAIDDAIYIRPQILVIFDNKYNKILISTPIFAQKQANYQELTAKITKIQSQIENSPKFNPEKFPQSAISPFKSNFSQENYQNAVKKCQKYIRDGDIFQVIPSQRFSAKFDKSIPEFNFYQALKELNPSPFLFFFRLKNFVLTGSSPEIMVSLKNNKVTIRPLAGTAKRGKTQEEDEKLAHDLLNNEKEIAEHLMLIDLGRHDVGRVCKAGTVELTQKMVIERYSHVMHISSNVEGQIRDDKDALDALISGFPPGTVSGAPKIRAMQIIQEIEQDKRSFYAGATGYFSSNGEMETCINLRSALIKDGQIHLQAGAGVVFDSDPESEYFECHNKAAALMKACQKILK